MERIYLAVRGASDRVNRVVEGTLFGLGLFMALLIGLQVFCRYVLNHSLFWSEELGRLTLVWLTFLGASVAYKRRAHVGLDFLVRRLPPGLQRVLAGLVSLCSLAFFWVMAFYGFGFLHFIRFQRTAALGLPQAVPFGVVPVSGCLLILHALVFLLETIRGEEGP